MRLPGSDKVIVGYDLGKDYAQISCYVTGKEEEITTLSSVAGSQVYTIPLVLSKRQGVNQWFYGSEALRHAEEEEGILVEHLLKLAKDGEPVQIDGTTLDPVALLTLFLKRSLGMLSQMTSTERIGALMITCEELDAGMLEVLTQAPVEYRCYCTRERVERALISMGRRELESLIAEQGGAELSCQFCDKVYHFERSELEALLAAL